LKNLLMKIISIFLGYRSFRFTTLPKYYYH